MDDFFTPAFVVYTVSVVGALVAGRAFRSVHKKNIERKKRLQPQDFELVENPRKGLYIITEAGKALVDALENESPAAKTPDASESPFP